jgi:uncharacterized protein YcbX
MEDCDVKLSGASFFDLGVVHLLTTASLERLTELYPGGRFDPRRFRPNVVLDLDSGEVGFVEDGWIGETLCIGDEVRLRITDPVARCVMTTLPHAAGGPAEGPGDHERHL